MENTIFFGDMIRIETELPLGKLLDIKISHGINQHSKLWLKAIIEDIYLESFFELSKDKAIKVYYIENRDNSILFSGKVQYPKLHTRGGVTAVEIYGISYSFELDEFPKRQSFQNPNLTYEDVIRMVSQDSGARYLSNIVEEAKIEKPILQYDETDWEFLIRLASHFNTCLQVSSKSDRPDYYFGINYSSQYSLEIETVIDNGFSEKYYECTGYIENQFPSLYHYMKTKDKKRREIGDYTYYNGMRYTVYEEQILIEKSSLYFLSTLGAPGLISQSKIYNEKIVGIQLAGTIQKVEQDYLCIQLNIDHENRADYCWPWIPEISNMGYFMPEIGENVLVFFPDEDEGHGQAVKILRNNADNGSFNYFAYREIVTSYDKTLALHPYAITLKGSGVSIGFSDDTGILINSAQAIHFNAKDKIVMTSGEIQMQAPQKVVLQTDESNIELCRDINLYAPEGVSRYCIADSSTDVEDTQDQIEKQGQTETPEKEHWQLSNGVIASIPILDFSTSSDKVSNLVACGTVPKFGKGSSIMSMSEVQEGKKTSDTSFPSAFSAMANYTLKGGRPLPKEEG